jgi:hypothetical protein
VKRTWIIAAAFVVGCHQPTSPTSVQRTREVAEPDIHRPWKPVVPLHHNIPVFLPDGTAGWVCETQPRRYVVNGVEEWTLDHYVVLGKQGCPDVPID